jgi:hypothetical protein
LGFHLLIEKPEDTKREKSITCRKGLFQQELEKSNKENFSENESWLTSRQPFFRNFNQFQTKRETEKKKL